MEIALDDFGTGYASLRHLKTFPIDKLKLDKSLIQASRNYPIVDAMISMAHGLGMSVVAEGVETTAHLDRLRSNGCDFVQGFLYSEPVDSEGMGRLTLKWRPSARPSSVFSLSPDFPLAEVLPLSIAVVDGSGAVVYNNKAWGDIAERGGLDARKGVMNYIGECEAAIQRGCGEAVSILKGLTAVLGAETQSFKGTYSCPFDGIHHWYQVQISPVQFRGAMLASLVHTDVSEMQRDPLTGLYNRAMFDAQLALALKLAGENQACTGVVVIDVNNLKRLNDTYGHSTGDGALKALAELINGNLVPGCVASRIGGDEFAVVLPVNNDVLLPRRLYAKLRLGDGCAISTCKGEVFVSASAGMALFPEDGITAGDLFKSADRAMYEQKRCRTAS